jgi:hypothetical protein
MLGVVCSHCGSNHTQAGCDAIQCLVCGNRTGIDNKKLPLEPVFNGENPHNRRPV